jgi:DNA polymerase I-like protein with 3'-5' exonuclease and polymerase domains/5'-3' exonuclease
MSNKNKRKPLMTKDKDSAPRLLIDINSLLVGALLGGKDDEALTTIVDGKVVSINSARYGVDKFFAQFVDVLKEFDAVPRDVIGVWDGKNAKAHRQGILPTYKSSTRSGPEYEQINLAREIVSQMLHDMGAHTVVCDACEADDVIAYLAKHMRTRKNIVVTGDGDLTVLVDDNTHVWRRGKLDENPYGPFPHRYITVYKALVGDTSDKIPGAKGFGDAAFVKLVQTFGVDGLELMEGLIQEGRLQELEEDVADLPALKKIIDAQAEVTASWRAALVYPDRVNTLRRPLQWRAGMVKQWHSLPGDARVEALKGYYGTTTLVHAGNYAAMKERLAVPLQHSPVVALDIETSVPEESLDWMEQTRSRGGKGVSVDVLGSTLTGMSLTFGRNLQHTIYITVDHREADGIKNVTSEQARALVEAIPQDTMICVWNRSFELQVLRNEWGAAWEDNGWCGFLPNCIDGMVEASYVNENEPLGLKHRSKTVLGYVQDTYEQTTTLEGRLGTLPPGGRRERTFMKEVAPARREWTTNAGGETEEFEVEPAVYEEWEARQYQMNELTAAHVFAYGCDDTIVTGALHTFQRAVMELEGTWGTFMEVELLPEYATSLATMQGVPIDLGLLRSMEREDQEEMAKHEATLNDYLIEKGWDGTSMPEIEMTPELVKRAVNIILGDRIGADGEPEPFTSRKRKLTALAEDVIDSYPESEERAALVANILRAEDRQKLQALAEQHFTGKPEFNPGSPKQVQRLLYTTIGMEARVLNPMTDSQRLDDKFRTAYYAKREYDAGTLGREPTEYERSVWASKASTDDAAIELALHKDDLPEREQEVLRAFLKIKELRTRFSLFYASWTVLPHWKDGRLHPEFNQCRAVTRRHSSNSPNLQQVTAHGEGAKIREALTAPKDWIHWSLDLTSQELLHQAHHSQDENMLSCFDLAAPRDIHSLVSVEASPFLWGEEIAYEQFQGMRKSDDEAVASRADALRLMAKRVVFGSAYGMAAPKLAIMLMTDEETAQKFLDAKEAAFPRLAPWKARVEAEAAETGTAFTPLGVPRHLRDALLSPNSWVRNKAARQASNYVIQAGSGEQLRLALASVWRSGVLNGKYRAQLIGPIHDELTGMVHRDDAIPVLRAVHEAMTQKYADVDVPIRSSLAIGRTFATPVEIGTSFTDEQLQAAVDKLFEKDAAN